MGLIKGGFGGWVVAAAAVEKVIRGGSKMARTRDGEEEREGRNGLYDQGGVAQTFACRPVN